MVKNPEIEQLENKLEALKDEYDKLIGDFKSCLDEKSRLIYVVDVTALQLVALRAALEMAAGATETVLKLVASQATPGTIPVIEAKTEAGKPKAESPVRPSVPLEEATDMLDKINERNKQGRIPLGPGKGVGDEDDG